MTIDLYEICNGKINKIFERILLTILSRLCSLNEIQFRFYQTLCLKCILFGRSYCFCVYIISEIHTHVQEPENPPEFLSLLFIFIMNAHSLSRCRIRLVKIVKSLEAYLSLKKWTSFIWNCFNYLKYQYLDDNNSELAYIQCRVRANVSENHVQSNNWKYNFSIRSVCVLSINRLFPLTLAERIYE